MASLLMLTFVVGCYGERDALRRYLAQDLPELTAGSKEVMIAFREIAARPPSPDRASDLEKRVLEPYRSVVQRLEAYAPEQEGIRLHHEAWLATSRRQLQAFEAFGQGLSAPEVNAMLRLTRADLDRWLEDVRKHAAAVELELIEP